MSSEAFFRPFRGPKDLQYTPQVGSGDGMEISSCWIWRTETKCKQHWETVEQGGSSTTSCFIDICLRSHTHSSSWQWLELQKENMISIKQLSTCTPCVSRCIHVQEPQIELRIFFSGCHVIDDVYPCLPHKFISGFPFFRSILGCRRRGEAESMAHASAAEQRCSVGVSGTTSLWRDIPLCSRCFT